VAKQLSFIEQCDEEEFLDVQHEVSQVLYSVETLTGIKFITWTLVIFVKSPETGRFLFFLAHILAYIPNFFFQMEGYAK
jgi:hypothetical protein